MIVEPTQTSLKVCVKKRKKMRLYGKRATAEQIMNEVIRLLLGNEKEEPLNVQEVASKLGFVRDTVYNYIKKAVNASLLEYGCYGRLVIPTNQSDSRRFRRFTKIHTIVQNPLVAEWKEDLLTRKQGEPLASWKTRIRSLESVCNTCKINPKDLLVSQKRTEKFLKNYVRVYSEGSADKDARGIRKSYDIKNVVYQRAQAVRDFCGYYGLTWKRGTRGVMSQTIPNHGKYADIRLTDIELDEADRFIKNRWGLDSDVYRWFWIGIESCARFGALHSMKIDHTKHESRTGKITYIMTAFESKTRHIKGGKWSKYITRYDTQKSIDLLKARGTTRIYESTLPKSKFRDQISKSLKEIYKHLGKNNYFEQRPTHVLRHIGAHYWLAKTNYHYGLVAIIGGWNTIDELRKSYGEIPSEMLIELIEKDNSSTAQQSFLDNLHRSNGFCQVDGFLSK